MEIIPAWLEIRIILAFVMIVIVMPAVWGFIIGKDKS